MQYITCVFLTWHVWPRASAIARFSHPGLVTNESTFRDITFYLLQYLFHIHFTKYCTRIKKEAKQNTKCMSKPY